MTQRVLPLEKTFIPETPPDIAPQVEQEAAPEKVLFDKADEAESLERLRFRREELEKEMEELKSHLGEDLDTDAKSEIKQDIEMLKTRLERLSEYIAKREEAGD
jgi:small conductance mechanosensitive channel